MLPSALLILLLDVVMSYGMAFKIVVVLGLPTLPAPLLGVRPPQPIPRIRSPLFFAVASTIFLFRRDVHDPRCEHRLDDGGRALVLDRSVARDARARCVRPRDGERQASPLPAMLIALAALTHGIVVFFVALGVIVLFLISADRHRFVYFATTGITAFALSAFWLVPFILTSRYMTDMKYEGAPTPGARNSYWRMFFPHLSVVDQFWTVLSHRLHRRGDPRHRAGVHGRVLAGARRASCSSKDGIPGFGLLWNVRLLPFIYLLRYLLAMVGIVEIVWFLVRAVCNARIAFVDTAGLMMLIGAIYVPGLALTCRGASSSPRCYARTRLGGERRLARGTSAVPGPEGGVQRCRRDRLGEVPTSGWASTSPRRTTTASSMAGRIGTSRVGRGWPTASTTH